MSNTTKLPTLFKRTKTGATQEWTIWIKGGDYWTVSGQTDGKKVTSAPTAAKPKNVGKKNETTAEQQAMSEARAKWQKKIDEGYSENLDAASAEDPLRIFPMLANEYSERKDKLRLPCFSQPKLDGLRCIITREGVYSRQWKPFTTVSFIHDACKWLFHRNHDILAFDGELYVHELADNFEKIVSLIKRGDPSEEELAEVKKFVRYHVYDYKSVQDSFCFGARHNRLMEALAMLPKATLDATIVPVETVLVTTDTIDEQFNKYLEEGYEGQMLRNRNGLYAKGRTDDLLKRKEFVEEDCTIIGHKEGEGNRAGCIVLRVRGPNGAEYDSTPGDMTVPMMKYLWSIRDQLLGYTAIVKRQKGYTRKGKARFNNTIRLRLPNGEPFVFPDQYLKKK